MGLTDPFLLRIFDTESVRVVGHFLISRLDMVGLWSLHSSYEKNIDRLCFLFWIIFGSEC